MTDLREVCPEKHFIYSMDIAIALNRGCNSYAHYDIELFEYSHELGYRVWHAIEDEFMGFGELFNLSYELYMREQEEE